MKSCMYRTRQLNIFLTNIQLFLYKSNLIPAEADLLR